ncbi:hypothetical protein GCM10010518_21910 [Kitasatospora cinereorecta]
MRVEASIVAVRRGMERQYGKGLSVHRRGRSVPADALGRPEVCRAPSSARSLRGETRGKGAYAVPDRQLRTAAPGSQTASEPECYFSIASRNLA